MLKRIVKLTFRPEAVDEFLEQVFEPAQSKIRAVDGCLHMELLRDTAQPNVLFTLSHWVSEHHLEQYRQSELFRQTWSKTKALFAAPPAAWSLEVL
jgi:heme oxygenase (mycobilin-producing)